MSAEAYSEELLAALEEREKYVQELNRKAIAIRRLSATASEIIGIRVPPIIEKIDVSRLTAVQSMGKAVSEIDSIKIPPVIPTMDAKRLGKVASLSEMCGQVISDRRKIVAVEIPLISIERATRLTEVVKSATVFSEAASSYRKLVAGTDELKKRLAEAVAEAEEAGIHFVKCDNCGSYTEVKEEVNG